MAVRDSASARDARGLGSRGPLSSDVLLPSGNRCSVVAHHLGHDWVGNVYGADGDCDGGGAALFGEGPVDVHTDANYQTRAVAPRVADEVGCCSASTSETEREARSRAVPVASAGLD